MSGSARPRRAFRLATALLAALPLCLVDCRAAETVAPAPSASESASSAAPSTVQVITDIEHWHHPTKAIFSRYGVTLRKVTIAGRYPTFDVRFSFDPQTSPNEKRLDELCAALLKANGQWPYSLIARDDKIAFDVAWDKRARKITIDNHAVTADRDRSGKTGFLAWPAAS